MSSTEEFKIGSSTVSFEQTKFSEDKISFIHLHENEQTAVQAANDCGEKLKGTFSRIKFHGTRNLCIPFDQRNIEFDPNRIFTEKGVQKTLTEFRSFDASIAPQVLRLGLAVTNMFVECKKLVVSLHNNDAHGECSINHYELGESVTAIHKSKNFHADDFFFVTEQHFFEYFKTRDFNVVLQSSQPEDDGSLSVYCAQHKIPYINIEAQHGHLREQVEMIELLMRMVDGDDLASQKLL